MNGGNLVLGVYTWQCHIRDIQLHLLVGESVSRIQIGKLENCLEYMLDSTQCLMQVDYIMLKKWKGRSLIFIEDCAELATEALKCTFSDERLTQTTIDGKMD